MQASKATPIPSQWICHNKNPVKSLFLFGGGASKRRHPTTGRSKFDSLLDAFTADVENQSPWRFVNPQCAMSCSDSRIVALLAAFFNPSDWGVTSGEFEYVQRVVDGDALVLGTGERVRLIGVNTRRYIRKSPSKHSAKKPRRSLSAWLKANSCG